MSGVFVDTTVWYALAATGDASHDRAVRLVGEHQGRLATSDHVLVETWTLVRNRRNRSMADELIATILEHNIAEVVTATPHDVLTALRIGRAFADQDFSLVDRTSWAVMERCGISEAVAFDIDFSVYRYGSSRRQAFTVHR